MPPDLWARFDPPEGFQLKEHTDKHHLITSHLDKCKFGQVNLACVSTLTIMHANLRHLTEANRTIEHRKKCPACYDYWMKRRAKRQWPDSLTIGPETYRREYQNDIIPLEDDQRKEPDV